MKPVFYLQQQSDLVDAISALDRYGVGFLALVDGDNKLLGVITDGDLRRAVLKKETDLQKIINPHPVTMEFGTSTREIVSRLRSLHRRHMPLVDHENVLHDVFVIDAVDFVHKENKVVIMAGGLGKRLGHLTKETPKPMLTVGDRPMLQHIIEIFRDQGFSDFIICVNYKKNVIQDYFQDGVKFGVSIEYIEENQPLGTAGALGLIDKSKLCAPFFIVNGDILTNLNFSDLLDAHEASECAGTMCIRQFSLQVPYGVVNCDGAMRILNIDEKPSLHYQISAGIYVLDPSVLRLVSPDIYLDMPSLFETIISDGCHCLAYRLDDYWLDIGCVEDFERARNDMSLS